MARRLVSVFTGFMLVITLIAASPVRAGSQEDTFRAIAGAVVLFAIGKAIADGLDTKAPAVTQKNTMPERSRIIGPGAAPMKQKDRPKYQGNVQRPSNRFMTLPSLCYFETTTRGRLVGVYGARCLQDHQARFNGLPRACQFQLPIRHGQSAQVYDAACLREFGWSEDRRARR
jgi:hypothetical protein